MIIIEWIVCAIFVIITSVLVEEEKGWWAFITLSVLSAAACWRNFFTNPLIYAWHHLPQTAGLISIYILIGIVWSLFKWIRYCYKQKRVVSTWKERFATDPTYTEAWKLSHLSPPSVSDNKTNIIRWIAWWPFSFLGTLIGDWIGQLFNNIFEALKGIYQSVSNRIWGDLATLPKINT